MYVNKVNIEHVLLQQYNIFKNKTPRLLKNNQITQNN